jgi:hypothetical protein
VLGALDVLRANQQDDGVQVRAGETRSRLMFETGEAAGGCAALAALLPAASPVRRDRRTGWT